MRDPITLDMHVPNATGGWTLAEAVARLQEDGMIALLEKNEDVISEHTWQFWRAIKAGETPTIGQILAAYYEAATEELDKAHYEDDILNRRQYTRRKLAVARLVFRQGR
jgi:hypothetical protein